MTAPKMPERDASEVMGPAEADNLIALVTEPYDPADFVEASRPEADYEALRRAVTVLRCDHSHPIQPPHGTLWEPGDCTKCGIAADTETVPDILAGPLAAFLDATADAMSFWAPYRKHENGYPMWITALAAARTILGEVTP